MQSSHCHTQKEMKMQVFFLLLCIAPLHIRTPAIIAAAAAATTSSFDGSERDRIALLAFKSKIEEDPQGVMSSWNESLHFCNWEGVTCGLRHRRVTFLNLESRGLVGSLSPYIGNLSFLREMRLPDNTLQGEIPPEVGRLLRLQVLNLSYNSFKGAIPANLSRCSNLVILNLRNNKLGGKIPEDLASLSKLKTLSIDRNDLEGSIPPSIGNLTTLESFSALANLIEGSIPDALGRLENLKNLQLTGNELSGTFPPFIYNLSSLINLQLADNFLHGSLSPNFGLTLPHLQHLLIWGNLLMGSIPSSLSNASKLEIIQMGQNNFTGKVSVDFSSMQNLSQIVLGEGNLESGEDNENSFLTSLANCSNLKYLGLWGNHFRGVLPVNFSNQLTQIYIAQNQFSGNLPAWIGTLFNLTVLSMERNQFTGTIPNDFDKLQKLQVVELHVNRLSGEIPSSLGNLSLLNRLNLANNRLQGAIPPSLGNYKDLYTLNLSQNNLSGTIPRQLFNALPLSISLNLAQNHFVGSLPAEIGNLDKLSELDISTNKLSGEIPRNLGRCISLEYLYMEGNFFQGSIPPLSSLRGVRNFDISHNNLSGQIPRFLENLSLKYLNLSFNNFEGEVPMKGVFTNRSAISVVGNMKLCGGMPELQLPRCTNKESKRAKMSFTLLLVILIVCALVGVSTVSSLLFCWFKRKRRDQFLGSLSSRSFFKVTYGMLLKATNGFSSENLIGMGSFGSVYKGIFDWDGTVVAVKVLNLQRQGASKSFMAECEALRNIRHRNLVKIITSCTSVDYQGNDFKALVYEFLPNGNLERWLHPILDTEIDQDQLQNLNLLQRINIAIDVACAIDYLHHDFEKSIIHCDLKPSNILLDNDMTAHIGDFGLSKFFPELANPTQSSSIGVRGTIGYAAPEYGLGSEVSKSGDVYSYGILLLEMMTGKRPTDHIFVEGLNLHHFARMALPDRVAEIVDPILLNDHEETAINENQKPTETRNGNKMVQCLISMVKIGVACSMDSPQDRMDISNAVHELHLIKNIAQGIEITHTTLT